MQASTYYTAAAWHTASSLYMLAEVPRRARTRHASAACGARPSTRNWGASAGNAYVVSCAGSHTSYPVTPAPVHGEDQPTSTVVASTATQRKRVGRGSGNGSGGMGGPDGRDPASTASSAKATT